MRPQELLNSKEKNTLFAHYLQECHYLHTTGNIRSISRSAIFAITVLLHLLLLDIDSFLNLSSSCSPNVTVAMWAETVLHKPLKEQNLTFNQNQDQKKKKKIIKHHPQQ